MKFIEYPDSEMMMIDLANVLAGELNNALMVQDRISFAVPGGSTPKLVFDALSAVRLDWDRVDLMLTDEWWVSETHQHSNTRLLRSRLLTDRAAAANFIPFYDAASSPEEAAAVAAEKVELLQPISVLLLGMGTDMSVASLLPGMDRLASAMADRAPAVMAMRGGPAEEPRITLTAPVLKGALSRHLVITGGKKRQALDRAVRTQDPLLAPIAPILPGMTVHWSE